MNLKVTAGQVFSYMTSVRGSAAYITWFGIIFTHSVSAAEWINKEPINLPIPSRLLGLSGSIDSIYSPIYLSFHSRIYIIGEAIQL
jgi:hypothetical protein